MNADERTRRRFLQELCGIAVPYALLRTLSATQLLEEPLDSELGAWVRSINNLCLDLHRRELTPSEWQTRIEEFLERIPVSDLLAGIRFEELQKRLDYPDLGVTTRRLDLPGMQGVPEGLVFFAKLFGVEKDRAIIPHGHRNMVSAHLVLGGEFHLRQFDRLADDEDALIVRPTVDEMVGPGSSSSISDERDNVHWLIARGGRGYTLDVIMTGLDPSVGAYSIQNLDPEKAHPLQGGLLRMPRLSVGDALGKYGKSHH